MKKLSRRLLSLTCLFTILPFFSSCKTNPSSTTESSTTDQSTMEPESSSPREKDMYLSITYLFQEGYDMAQITFDYGFLGEGLDYIQFDDDQILLAGDCLKVTYTGKWTTTKDFPCTHTLKGKIISYSIDEARQLRIMADEGEHITEDDFSEYYFYDEAKYVITDERLHYKKLSETQYDVLYYVLAEKKYDYFDKTDIVLGLYTERVRTYASLN